MVLPGKLEIPNEVDASRAVTLQIRILMQASAILTPPIKRNRNPVSYESDYV